MPTASVVVAADSKTVIGSYAGTLGLSLSGSAVGISIGIVVDLDETSATVGEGTTITALGRHRGLGARRHLRRRRQPGLRKTFAVWRSRRRATMDVFLLAIAASGSLGQDNSGQSGVQAAAARVAARR